LHYVLDIWFEGRIKKECDGEAHICRYADDFIGAFRFRRDATRSMSQLRKRLKEFGLEVAEEKTNLISFSRWRKEENTCFDFLGFEFRWGVDRKGKDSIRRRTSRKKLRKSLKNLTQWCKENRHLRLKKFFSFLNAKLRGYYNHYGIIGNSDSLEQFHNAARRILFKWLNRRSQRRSFNWKVFDRVLKIYGMVTPRIVEKNDDQLKLDFSLA
jgi:RNA-directed DNA polymerase